jgi:D-beta-D-heptose 7-phosphate kinase/D-beta-D-heptose 1-phosphate adenosyltransferase
MVDPHRINYGNYHGITIAKPNRKEAELATGLKITDTKSAFQAARQLRQAWQSEMMIITLSEMGMILSGPGDAEYHLPTEAREVYDVSGAGDCVTAVFTVALAVGATPFVAGILANVAAGIVVSELGTVPITIKKLREKVRELLIIHPDRLAIL